jgi:large conductance mechanosensitive channel
LWKEFKEFALKGNVFDLAVALIIGLAFAKIVDSLVTDIIMPVVGAITGGLDFSNYFAPLSGAVTSDTLAAAKEQGAVLAYGNFITVVVNFLIVAFVLFLLVKMMNRFKRRAPVPVATPPRLRFCWKTSETCSQERQRADSRWRQGIRRWNDRPPNAYSAI